MKLYIRKYFLCASVEALLSVASVSNTTAMMLDAPSATIPRNEVRKSKIDMACLRAALVSDLSSSDICKRILQADAADGATTSDLFDIIHESPINFRDPVSPESKALKVLAQLAKHSDDVRIKATAEIVDLCLETEAENRRLGFSCLKIIGSRNLSLVDDIIMNIAADLSEIDQSLRAPICQAFESIVSEDLKMAECVIDAFNTAFLCKPIDAPCDVIEMVANWLELATKQLDRKKSKSNYLDFASLLYDVCNNLECNVAYNIAERYAENIRRIRQNLQSQFSISDDIQLSEGRSLQTVLIPGDGDCGFHAMNYDYDPTKDKPDSRKWAINVIRTAIDQNNDRAQRIRNIIARELISLAIEDKGKSLSDIELLVDVDDDAKVIIMQIISNDQTAIGVKGILGDANFNAAIERHLDKILTSRLARYWMTFHSGFRDSNDGVGIGDALGEALNAPVIVIDGRHKQPSYGKVIHSYTPFQALGEPEIPAEPIYLIQASDSHYNRGKVIQHAQRP